MSVQQSDFESDLDSYKDRLSEFKDISERLASGKDPLEAIRQTAGLIGTPLSIDLLKTGFKGQYGNAIQSFKNNITSKANEAIQSLKTKALELGQKVQDSATDAVTTAQNTATDALTTARDSATDAVTDASDAIRNTVSENVQNVQDAANGLTDNAPTTLGGDAAYVVPGSQETSVFETLPEPEPGTIPNPVFDPADAETGGLLGQNVGSETTSPFASSFQGTPEELSTMDDILNARIPVGINSISPEQFDTAVAGRVSAIRAGAVRKVGVGELDEMDPITRARFSDTGDLLEAGQEPSVALSNPIGTNMVGGLRGDSTIARALQGRVTASTPAPDPEPVEPEPTPEPETVTPDPDLAVGTQVENEVSSNVSAVTRLTGDTTEAAEGVLSGVTEGVTTAATEGVDAGIIATGEGIAATTGAETGGLGSLLGGLVALGGVLASVFAPHKEPPKEVIPNYSSPALQVGLGA